MLLFGGCTSKTYIIEDISTLPQNTEAYASNIEAVGIERLKEFDENYNKIYFKPWHIERFQYTKEESMWGFAYEKMDVYGQNYRLLPKEWFEKLKQNSNFEEFDKSRLYGISIRNSDLRVLPTDKPLFFDPQKAGEGYPFDYNQNSSVYLNTPLFISHYSKDRAWVFAQTPFAAGWLDARDIALISDETLQEFQTNDYAIALKDNFPLYLDDGSFIEYIKLGTIFPIKEGNYMIIGKSGEINYIKDDNIVKKPISFDSENIHNVIEELKNEPYGWGGLSGTRDCSSMTRDFFSPFGIYLNRNSSGQIKNGNYIDLENLSSKEKKVAIIKTAEPFKTLLYAKGHIMLYAGHIEDEPVIFHQFWGIKTLNFFNQEGRFIVGEAAFTSLEPGKEISNFDEKSSLLKRIKGMVIVIE